MNPEKRQYKEDPNDDILQHFILAAFFIFETIIKVLNLIVPSPQKGSIKDEQIAANDANSSETQIDRSVISKKSPEELKVILNEVDMMSSINKMQLVDLVLSNPEAISKVRLEQRKSELLNLTNPELRSMLKGVDKISRLKKIELIEIIISEEKRQMNSKD